jgi:hypothetical protein
MSNSDTSPRSFSTSQLRRALGDVGGPARTGYLGDIVVEAARMRQRPAWTLLERWVPLDVSMRRQGLPRTVVVFIVLSLLVLLLVGGAVYVGSQTTPALLPSTPDAWSRIRIDSPATTGRVASLAVSPHGLLAAVGGDEPTHLERSTDGRKWTPVPDGQLPSLSNDRTFGMPFLLGTDRGFLLLQLGEVWSSEDGYDWHRVASDTTDPDLRLMILPAATSSGSGLVAVDGDTAWYAADGSDWSLADVPPLPSEILAAPDQDRHADMTGVTAVGNDLVAWGAASVALSGSPDEHLELPILWASHDGRTWASVVDPDMESVTAVTGGPNGFVATGRTGSGSAVWVSADGEAWERVGDDVFAGQLLEAPAATDSGYVVVGNDGPCQDTSCPDRTLVIWTSPDGRSWSHVPSAERFTGAKAYGVRGWGSSFVILGAFGGTPAIWISEPPGQ